MPNTLREAIRITGIDPTSSNALKLKEAILAGKMDVIAKQEGLDLSAFKKHFGDESQSSSVDPRIALQKKLASGQAPDASTMIQSNMAMATAGADRQAAQDAQIKSKLQEGISPVSKIIGGAVDKGISNLEATAIESKNQADKYNTEGGLSRIGGVGANMESGAASSAAQFLTGLKETVNSMHNSLTGKPAENPDMSGSGALAGPTDIAGGLLGFGMSASGFPAAAESGIPVVSQTSQVVNAAFAAPIEGFIGGVKMLAERQGVDTSSPEYLQSEKEMQNLLGLLALKVYPKVLEKTRTGTVKTVPAEATPFNYVPEHKIQTGSKTTGIFEDVNRLKQQSMTAGDLTKAVETQPQFLPDGKPNPLYVAPFESKAAGFKPTEFKPLTSEFKRSTPTEVAAAADVAVPIIKPDVLGVVTKAETLKNNIHKTVTKTFTEGLDSTIAKYGNKKFKDVIPGTQKAIKEILATEKIKLTSNYIFFNESAFGDSVSQGIIRDFLLKLDTRTTPTAEVLRNIGQQLSKLRSKAFRVGGSVNAVVGQMYDAFRNSLEGSIKEIKPLNEAYSKGMTVLNDARKYLKLNAEKNYLSIDKPGKAVVQKAIKAAEDYARGLGIEHPGDLVAEAKAIIDSARKSKIANTAAKEQIKAKEVATRAELIAKNKAAKAETIAKDKAAKEDLIAQDKVIKEVRDAKVNMTKEKIAIAAKEVNMETASFHDLLTKIAKGEKSAAQKLITAVKENSGKIVRSAVDHAIGGTTIGFILKWFR